MSVSWLAGLVVAAGVLGVATGVGLWHRGRDGSQVHAANGGMSESPTIPPMLADLGVVPGTPATLLQFSSAFCARCRATRVVCRQVAAELDGVRHLEVDAESHLEAVRTLKVWRTPTVFVVDAAGRLVARVTGQPTRAQLTEATQPLLAPEVRS